MTDLHDKSDQEINEAVALANGLSNRCYSPTTDWRDTGPLLKDMGEADITPPGHSFNAGDCWEVVGPELPIEGWAFSRRETSLQRAICIVWLRWQESKLSDAPPS